MWHHTIIFTEVELTLLTKQKTYEFGGFLQAWVKSQLSSPGPKPFSPKPKTKGPWADTKLLQATTTTTTHHHPLTFKHEGGVPQQNSMSKNILEWSPILVQPNKFQVDSERKDMG